MKNLIPIIITFSTFSILTLATVAFQSLHDSPTAELYPLTVGDPIPPISTTISINAQTNKDILKTTSNKLVILQFINTHCGTCRQSIPHLEKLQSKFPDSLTIILATRQQAAPVQDKALKYNWTLPIITEDTTLNRLFPYRAVPHQVWIKDHKVIAITNWEYANETNIQTVLSGQTLLSPLKHEEDIDLYQPLLQMPGTTPLYQSAITGPLPNGLQGIKRTDHSYLLYNYSALALYEHAFNLPTFPLGAYSRVQLNDSLKFLLCGPSQKNTGLFHLDQQAISWKQKHNFCYNIVYPDSSKISTTQYRQQMRADLNAFFNSYWGIVGEIQTILTEALVLEQVSNGKEWRADQSTIVPEDKEAKYQLINKSIKLFISNTAFYHRHLKLPVVNNTGYEGNINLSLNSDLTDLHELNKALEPYGLKWSVKKTNVELLMIKKATANDRYTQF